MTRPLLASVSRDAAAARRAPTTLGSSCVGAVSFATSTAAHLCLSSFLLFSEHLFLAAWNKRWLTLCTAAVFARRGKCHAQHLRSTSGSCHCDDSDRRVGLRFANHLGPSFAGQYSAQRLAAAAEWPS